MKRKGDISRLLVSLYAALFFGLLAPQGLNAQVDTGAILGTIKDQSGAIVPGAKVTVTNEGTAYSNSTVSGSDGTYIFTPLRIGTYAVSAEFQGFQRAERTHVTLDVQQQAVVDFSLVPGAVTQTIEVTTAAPLLQTENASVGEVVNSKAVNDLPLNGRNFTFLAQLTAGVTVGQEEGRGLNASGDFSANGNRPSQNNYLLDGIDNNIDLVDFLNGTAYVVLPPVDAISEFKVQTSNYSAELGRAGGAVLNAAVKSGTNQIHGDVWEFFRNDKLDARDFFESQRGEYRQNQFGGAVGGPIAIPHIYDGRNKTFFFADYQGTRIRQASPYNVTVPTSAEAASGFTNFADLITSQPGCTKGPDAFGNKFPCGTIFDPATTRPVTAGTVDPVTGKTAVSTGFVRDPFAGNIIPAGRIDPNAIKILKLFPTATAAGIFNNFQTDPVVKNDANSMDARVDENFSEKDTAFARFSYLDNPQFKPGPFNGVADGGGFNQGNQTATSIGAALSETHSFSSSLINEARLGFNRIGTGRLQPNGSTTGIPAQFGIQGIPQIPLNGGLPAFGIGNYQQLGSNAFLVSSEYNSTLQLTENLTKIYHSHTFKGGAEFQHIKFSTLQPPWSRGQFNFNGNYTQIPNNGDGSVGVAQLLLTPIAATVPGGINNVGGANATFASNQVNTDDGRNYYGGYFQDDWKMSSKLTLNLGLRWDYFAQVEENFGAQANFVPGANGSQAQYLIPIQRKKDPLSPSFLALTAKDGINVAYTNNLGLGKSQKSNFAPRFGFAYQATPKFVVRGGYGLFYGGFENRGYSPNIGEAYPFQFSFAYFNPNDQAPISYTNADGSACGTATLEQGFNCIPLSPSVVNASGLQLRGIQYNYITPYTQSANFMLEYELTPTTSFEVGYVGSSARHLEVFPGSNEQSILLVPGANRDNFKPYPDFSYGASYAATEGSSYYHSLQTKLTRRFSDGLNLLATYTYSKGRSDADDLLNGGGQGGYRAPYLPGFGIQGDYQLTSFDIRNVFHFSGGYELPFGHGKKYMTSSSKIADGLLGGWTTNFILTLQDGQPNTVGCHGATPAAGTGCNALLVPGQNITAGPHDVNQWINPAAFTQPPPVTANGQANLAPLGGKPTQFTGPGFHRLDFSLFKQLRTSERTYLEFRGEFFNLTNHPNFSDTNISTDFTNPSQFGKIHSTRDNPNDPRQIQFALKFYW